jgi:hypothetical protein
LLDSSHPARAAFIHTYFAIIMKDTILMILFCSAVAAFPLSKAGAIQAPRNISNCPGIQFNNGKLAITVFSDLHFGERKL